MSVPATPGDRAAEVIAPWLDRLCLTPDGAPFATPSSVLAPVTSGGVAAVLKVATAFEEELGGRLMAWWDGRGAAPVLAHDGPAIVLVRAEGQRSLTRMALLGGAADDDATRVLCAAAARLHAVHGEPPAGVVDLDRWFAELFAHAGTPHANSRDGFFARSASVARDLLGDQRETVVLHADIHHGNVLDFGELGWLAIDPKHVAGDRAFDYVNILCNPDARVALAPGRLARQIEVICEESGIARDRLLAWTVAWCGLSSAWTERSGLDAGPALEVGRDAERMLG